MTIPNQFVSLQENLLIHHYIDDSLQERPKDAPASYRPLLKNYEDLGFYISHEKGQLGTQIDYIGYSLDFSAKTVRIKDSTLQKTFDKILQGFSLNHENFGLCISLTDLEKLLGSLEFLANVCLVGRSRTSHLVRLFTLSKKEHDSEVVLDACSYAEIKFWAQYCKTPEILPMATKELSLYQLKTPSYSDASNQRWAYFKYDNFSGEKVAGSGPYPSCYQNTTILFKECYALYHLIMILPENSQNYIHVDNQALAHLWRKTRSSKDLNVNRYLELMNLEIHRKNCSVELQWISTQEMELCGADGLSRDKLDKIFDPYSLSDKGVTYLKRRFGGFDQDLFASAANYFPGSQFSSCYDVAHDSFTGMTGQEALQKPLRGKILLFPGVCQTIQSLQLLSLNPSRNYEIVILIRSKYFPLAYSLFRDRVDFNSYMFVSCKERAKKYLNKQIKGTDLILIHFGSITKSSCVRKLSGVDSTVAKKFKSSN